MNTTRSALRPALLASLVAMLACCKDSRTANDILTVTDAICDIVDASQIDPTATTICVLEDKLQEVLRELLLRQKAAAMPGQKGVVLRLPKDRPAGMVLRPPAASSASAAPPAASSR